VSTFRFAPQEARPGLPVLPLTDDAYPESFKAGSTVPRDAVYACTSCGETLALASGATFPACSACEGEEWVMAFEGLLDVNRKP
ncbi:MAG: hypothetical protein ACRDIB_04615, partial [Ardenticatenaceae bacterium]